MTLRSDILARFKSEGGAAPLFLPDLTLWHAWHRERDTLPSAWRDFTLPQVARHLNAPIWAVMRPWQATTPGIITTSEESVVERVIRHETPFGTLTTRFTRGPDGDWWLTEYPVKSTDDLAAARALIDARSYAINATNLADLREDVGEDGVIALELPMRPYAEILHAFVGWSEGLMLFAGDGRPILLEMLADLEEKVQGLAAQVAALPGDLLLSPDNLDGQYISPRVFRDHFAEGYRMASRSLYTSAAPSAGSCRCWPRPALTAWKVSPVRRRATPRWPRPARSPVQGSPSGAESRRTCCKTSMPLRRSRLASPRRCGRPQETPG
jgi:hypothetical protein